VGGGEGGGERRVAWAEVLRCDAGRQRQPQQRLALRAADGGDKEGTARFGVDLQPHARLLRR